jgi:hypothetical protein
VPSTRDKLFITLYLDEDITPKLAKALRDRGFDAVSAYEVGNIEVSDSMHLDFAATQGRAILSCNAKHYVPLFKERYHEGREHSGVIVTNQIPLGEMLCRILGLLNPLTADEIRNQLRHLGEFAKRE